MGTGILLIFSVIMATATTTHGLECWQRSGNRFFKCFNDNRVTYQQANDNCTSYGGRLAAEVLRDPDVASYIVSNCFSSDLRPWVGFNGIAQEDTWIWSDGGVMSPATTAWNAGEPNNYKGTDEDCGHVSDTAPNKIFLNDNQCELPHSYICEV